MEREKKSAINSMGAARSQRGSSTSIRRGDGAMVSRDREGVRR